MPTTIALFTQGRGNRTRGETALYSSRGGTFERRANPVQTEITRKTFGRFSVRGPAAWRKDGGTGKNSNTMCSACKDLPYNLWRHCQCHKPDSQVSDTS